MKSLFKVSVFLWIFIFLNACQQASQASQATPLSPLSPGATSTSTVTHPPSPTATATPAPMPTSTHIAPTHLPIIDPDLVPGGLNKVFSIQTFTGLGGYGIQQITGWEYGFGGVSGPYSYPGYYWLDASHLLLYPSLGENIGLSLMWEDFAYQPVVINLEDGYAWLPDPGVYWSSELGVLIDARYKTSSEGDQREAVYTYTFDGQRIAFYSGKLNGVSPSRTKILIDNRWIDLKSGKTVAFKWDKDFDKNIDIYFPRPLWSSDETQVYTCCYKYGNARTGESFTFLPDDVSLDGEEIDDTLYHAYGTWVLNDSHLLVQFDWFNSIPLDFIPLFDIEARTLHNLDTLAGIPTEKYGPHCPMAFASPDGKSIWAKCDSGGYLVDLATFSSIKFPPSNSYDYPTWSADSQFAWMETEPRQILSVPGKTLSSLPVDPRYGSDLWWHPSENVIAYPSTDDNKVIFLDTATMLSQELPFALQKPPVYETVTNIVWSPNGEKLALVAEDGSIWQVDYPALKNLKQVTISFPEVSTVNWSPDGNSIAFLSGADIFVVDTIK